MANVADHGPVEEHISQKLTAIAAVLHDELEPDGFGFVLLASAYGDGEAGRINYISTMERESVRRLMIEMLARFAAQEIEAGAAGGIPADHQAFRKLWEAEMAKAWAMLSANLGIIEPGTDRA